jgi:hypothetical protein
LQQFFTREKQLVRLEELVPLDQKLMGQPILNTEILFQQLMKSAAWQRFLPEKGEESRAYVYNLMNTCSGLGLELILVDALERKKKLGGLLKAYVDDSCKDGAELEGNLPTGADLDVVAQYRNQRSNMLSRAGKTRSKAFKA